MIFEIGNLKVWFQKIYLNQDVNGLGDASTKHSNCTELPGSTAINWSYTRILGRTMIGKKEIN